MSTPTITADRQTLRRVVTAYSIRPGWIVLALFVVVALGVGEIPRRYQYAPLVVSVLLLGLPHGAVDHLVIARQRDESLSVRWLSVVGGIYLFFGAAYAAVWFRFPVAAFVFFILLTWFHWGQGELYPLREIVGVTALRRPSQRALSVVVRGGAPMLVPLVAFPGEYEYVAGTLVGLFDDSAATALGAVFEPRVRAAVGVVYGVALLATVALGYVRASEREPWLVDTAEMLLLTVFFLTVPPILAVGVYFCFWHSLRHVVRTVLLHDASAGALERGQIWRATGQFARDAAPMTAGALVLLGSLYVLVPQTPAGAGDLVGLYLVLIAVLTLPHVVIVTWLDREQGIWLAAESGR